MLRGEYYIQLPQDSIDLINVAGSPYRLTTFTGAADLRTLTVEAIKRDILDATHQDGPTPGFCAYNNQQTLCDRTTSLTA
jgi:hypothetical protein